MAAERVQGQVVEIGFGQGYGVPIYQEKCDDLTLIDKSGYAIENISKSGFDLQVIQCKVPPLTMIATESVDTLIAFQFLEHIKDAELFFEEVFRVLRPGGRAYLTTPNRHRTLIRNPWHFREYDPGMIRAKTDDHFNRVIIKGIHGSEQVEQYMALNAKAVHRLKSLDPLGLHERVPAWSLKIPYELLNRLNRLRLLKDNRDLAGHIDSSHYSLKDQTDNALDLWICLEK